MGFLSSNGAVLHPNSSLGGFMRKHGLGTAMQGLAALADYGLAGDHLYETYDGRAGGHDVGETGEHFLRAVSAAGGYVGDYYNNAMTAQIVRHQIASVPNWLGWAGASNFFNLLGAGVFYVQMGIAAFKLGIKIGSDGEQICYSLRANNLDEAVQEEFRIALRESNGIRSQDRREYRDMLWQSYKEELGGTEGEVGEQVRQLYQQCLQSAYLPYYGADGEITSMDDDVQEAYLEGVQQVFELGEDLEEGGSSEEEKAYLQYAYLNQLSYCKYVENADDFIDNLVEFHGGESSSSEGAEEAVEQDPLKKQEYDHYLRYGSYYLRPETSAKYTELMLESYFLEDAELGAEVKAAVWNGLWTHGGNQERMLSYLEAVEKEVEEIIAAEEAVETV